MRLLILSHTPHHSRSGEPVGWGPTVREIDCLAGLFSEVVHIAPLHPGPAPESELPYASPRVRLRPVPPAGGDSPAAKLRALTIWPLYARLFLEELRRADVVHVRCPANIALLGILLLALRPEPRRRWVKYAGNWAPEGRESPFYRLQRWWLRRGLHRGVVTVNGIWPDQPPHVHAFYNPCLTREELEEARGTAAEKRLEHPVRLIFVGALEPYKGIPQILRIVEALHRRGVPVHLDLVGDGPRRAEYEAEARSRGIDGALTFHGWLPRPAIGPLYARAHLFLFPSASEGWPKVLSEAMAYGVVPLASRVSSIPQYLADCGTGRTFDPHDVEGFAEAAAEYAARPEQWLRESRRGVEAAGRFSYDHYLDAVRRLLELERDVAPAPLAAAGGA